MGDPRTSSATATRRLRDAVEPIATIGYHAPLAQDAYAAAGLEGLASYVWVRTSSLGEPDPSVAAAAFGVWEPHAVARAYEQGRAVLSLARMREVRLDAAARSLREVLGEPAGVAGLEETVVALEEVVSEGSRLGRPMFAGLTAHPRPPDLLGRLWHSTNCLRERRGDSHLAALVGAEIDGVQANVLNELWNGYELFAYTETRFWSHEQMTQGLRELQDRGLVVDGELTAAGRDLREQIEQTTEDSEQVVVRVLGPHLDEHASRLEDWARQIIDHGWFPDEPAKRAAG